MDLFVCSSNYQLLNAIMIIKENRINAHLLIIRESIWSGCDLNVLTRDGFFKEIYKWTALLEHLTDEKIKNLSDKIKIQGKKFFIYLNKRAIWRSLPNKDNRYEKVHIAYIDSLTLWIYTYFKRTGAKLSLFEDGTYSYGCLDVEKSNIRRITEYFLYKGRGIDECVQMYIKHPEQVKLGVHKDVSLLKIKDQFDNQTIAEVLFPLYRASPSSISVFERPVIIFDQNLELKEVKEIQKDIAQKTVDVFGNENVLVKLHPSSRDIDYGEHIYTFNNKIPFELVMAYEGMNRKVLVSIFSTACMSPKLDFDQEPYIIFTYKLYGDRFIIGDTYLDQIEQLQDRYADETRIAVPNDINDFVRILNTFKEELK